jgi:hypothetical protein
MNATISLTWRFGKIIGTELHSQTVEMISVLVIHNEISSEQSLIMKPFFIKFFGTI